MPVKVPYKVRAATGKPVYYKTQQGNVIVIYHDDDRKVFQWCEAHHMLEYSPQEWVKYCTTNGLQLTEEPKPVGEPSILPDFDHAEQAREPKQYNPCADCGRTDVYGGHSCIEHPKVKGMCARCFRKHLVKVHHFTSTEIAGWIELNSITDEELAAPPKAN